MQTHPVEDHTPEKGLPRSMTMEKGAKVRASESNAVFGCFRVLDATLSQAIQ